MIYINSHKKYSMLTDKNSYCYSTLRDELRELYIKKERIWKEFTSLVREYPNIWKLARRIGEVDQDLMGQHNFLRQLLIFKREKNIDYLNSIEKKSKYIINKIPLSLIKSGMNTFVPHLTFLKELEEVEGKIHKRNIELGGEVRLYPKEKVFHATIACNFFRRDMKGITSREQTDEYAHYITNIKQKSITKRHNYFRALFEKYKIELSNLSEYVWVASETHLNKSKGADFTNIYYSVGFDRRKKDNGEDLIVFIIPISKNRIFRTSIFSDGTGPFFRTQLRDDRWGEAVNALTLQSSIPEGLIKKQLASSKLFFGEVKNIEVVNSSEINEMKNNSLLKESLINMKENW